MALALEYRDFGFAYPAAGSNAACSAEDAPLTLQGVDWDVEEGKFAVLIGATGSGKTTLMRNAVPALRPVGKRSGCVLLGGVDTEDMSLAQAATAVGYVAQNPDAQIVCDTVWHQLAFGLENTGVLQADMRRIIAEVSHFLGITGWFRKKTSELSGGQRQLLNLASVLVMKPRLLLLDEPVSMLDPVAQKNFMHILQRLNRELGLTVVVATHSPLGFVPYASGFFELRGGSVFPVSEAQVQSGTIGLSALSSVDARVVDKPVAPVKQQPAVVLSDVYTRYAKTGDFVLRGMDLCVTRGSIHAVIGGNGSGKSTLLRVIAGLMKPERGKLRNALSARQALLPQDPKALFVRDTVLEELQEWQRACGYDDAAVDAALQRCGLEGCLALHPYDLSGGQQQLLALAKLTLTDPDLLLLDEPTKGLDPAARLQVAFELRRLRAEGRTMVLATHDLPFASAVADDVSLLFDGQAACTQPAREFFEQSVFYRPDRDAFTAAWERERGEAR